MAAGISRAPQQENVSSTLSSGITDVAGSADVADASKFNNPSYLMIDRVDSSGTLKSTSLWELVKVTNISSNTLTITRGQGGTTAQAHSAGAVIEAVVSAAQFEEWYAVLNPEHTATGTHVMGTATVNFIEGKQMALTSVASVPVIYAPTVHVKTALNASGASLSGIPITAVFSFIGALSGATTFVQTPLVMPRSGRFSYANVITRTVASGVSAIVDINLNGTSLFDAVGRPMIAAGGTFVSTASLATKNFFKGDRLTWDYDGTGGLITDFNIQLTTE